MPAWRNGAGPPGPRSARSSTTAWTPRLPPARRCGPNGMSEPEPEVGTLHHVEVRVAHLDLAEREWAWLLEALGYREFLRWDGGIGWRRGPTYLVVEQAAYD